MPGTALSNTFEIILHVNLQKFRLAFQHYHPKLSSLQSRLDLLTRIALYLSPIPQLL